VQNGYSESFYGKLHDELPNGSPLKEAQFLIECCRQDDSPERPISTLGCHPPASHARGENLGEIWVGMIPIIVANLI
jgi:hypothetical protein